MTNEQVNAAYSHARVLLFPSLEEGFGWPVIEAMASDCPVITTNAAPMTEIAGQSARLVPRMPGSETERSAWAKSVAGIMEEVINLNDNDRARMLQQGRWNAARFDPGTALSDYEKIYHHARKGLNQ